MNDQLNYNGLANVYRQMLGDLFYDFEFETSPRQQKIREIINAQYIMDNPSSNMFKNEARDVPKKYLARELLLYFAGRKDLEGFAHASKFWNNIANEDKTVNSAYGYLIFKHQNSHGITQWQWAKNSLLNDKDSRQALMFVSTPDVQSAKVKDFVCTLNYVFLIREDTLYLTVNRRSQDIILGFTFDAIWECLLLQLMRLELLEKYPNLKLGPICFNMVSLHLYERDFELAEKMLSEPFIEDKLPEIVENPILNKNIIDMSLEKFYQGEDQLFCWLDEYK